MWGDLIQVKTTTLELARQVKLQPSVYQLPRYQRSPRPS